MQLIIILDRTSVSPMTANYLMRATVPAARQSFFADPTKMSAYKQASAGDIAALQAGQIVEKVNSLNYDGMNAAAIKVKLIADQAAFQTEVNGQSYNPWIYYGSSWDGSAWTMAGVS